MPPVRVFHSLCLALLIICLPAVAVGQADQQLSPPIEPLSAENQRDFDIYLPILTGQAYDVNVRRRVAIRLLQRGWPQGINEILTVLQNNEDPQGQLAVAEALAETLPKLDSLPDRFVDPLIAALSAKDENLRQAAASAVANYKTEVLSQLSRIILQQDPATTETTRLAAVAAVERIKDKKSAQILIDALDLDDENSPLSVRCREGLEQIFGIHFDDNDAWQQWWLQYKDKDLAELQRLYIVALMNQNRELQKENKQFRDQLRIQIEVQWDTAQDKPQLLEKFLDNPLEDVRLQALLLAKTNLVPGDFTEELEGNIRELLADPSAPVRAKAAELLRDLRDELSAKQSAIIILELLPQETDPGVRASFAEALGYIGGPGAVQPLIELLADPDPLVVGQAASALGNLAATDDVGPLKDSVVQALLDQYQKTTPTNGADARLRRDILSAMGKVGSSSFRLHFLQALNDDLALSRIAALEGLRTLPPNNSGRQTLAAIRPLLADPDRGVRFEVLRALDHLVDLGALEALGKRLDPNVEPDADMQDAVWRVIIKLLAKADLDTLNDWERKAAVVDVPERHEQVLGILEVNLAEARTNPIRLIKVREKLGGYRESLKSWEAAAVKYRLAYDQAKTISDPSISQTRDGLALKLLNALLNQPAFDQAAEHLEAIARAPSPLEKKALNRTMEYLKTHLDAPVVSKSVDDALELILVLEKADLPGLTQPPLSDTLSGLKVEALNLRRNSNKVPGAL